MYLNSERGLTLVEILASMVIFTMVIGTIYLLLEHGIQIWHQTSEETDLRNQAYTAIAYVQKELNRTATPPEGEEAVVITPAASTSRLEIRTKWDTASTPPVVAESVIFEFRPDPNNAAITRLYRGTLTNQPGVPIGLADINFMGSYFARSGNHIRIKLQLRGPRGLEYRLDTSIPIFPGQ